MVDNYTRECLAIEVDSCLSSQPVTRVLERVMEQRGGSDTVRCDNDPEIYEPAFSGVVRKAEDRPGTTFNLALRCRTGTSRALMAGSAMDA